MVVLLVIATSSYLVTKRYNGTSNQNKISTPPIVQESVDEYNKRKRKEALLRQGKKEDKNETSNNKVDPEYGRELTIDGWDPATNSIIDPLNLWENYETRTYAGKVRHGNKVWYVRRNGDGILIETKSGQRGWITYFFIREFKNEMSDK